MEGVEILSQTTCWTAGKGELIAGILCTLLVLTCLYFFINSLRQKDLNIIAFNFLMLFLCAGIYLFYLYFNRTSYEEYKVTISDEVKLNEFLNQYEIITKEGKIYTVKIKGD